MWEDELKKKSFYAIRHKERLVYYTETKYPSLRLAELAFEKLRCSNEWEIIALIELSEATPFIESLLKQARIDENIRNLDMFLSLPDSQFTDLEIGVILRNRIKQLEEK